MIAGSLAGISEHAVMFPVDVIRVSLPPPALDAVAILGQRFSCTALQGHWMICSASRCARDAGQGQDDKALSLRSGIAGYSLRPAPLQKRGTHISQLWGGAVWWCACSEKRQTRPAAHMSRAGGIASWRKVSSSRCLSCKRRFYFARRGLSILTASGARLRYGRSGPHSTLYHLAISVALVSSFDWRLRVPSWLLSASNSPNISLRFPNAHRRACKC